MDLLSEILSSPEKLDQVMSIAKTFLGDNSAPAGENAAPAAAAPGNAVPASAISPVPAAEALPAPPAGGGAPSSGGGGNDFGAILEALRPMLSSAPPSAAPAAASAPGMGDILSGLDPKIMSLAMNLLGEYSNDDEKIKLLYAIKPHLSHGRHDRLDKAVQMFRISKTVRALMKGLSD